MPSEHCGTVGVVVVVVVVVLDGGASVEELLEPTSPGRSASVTEASGSAAPALPVPALPITARAAKIGTAIQIALGAWVLVGSLIISGLDWFEYGGGRTKPELYGIWTVNTFILDGISLPPRTDAPVLDASCSGLAPRISATTRTANE